MIILTNWLAVTKLSRLSELEVAMRFWNNLSSTWSQLMCQGYSRFWAWWTAEKCSTSIFSYTWCLTTAQHRNRCFNRSLTSWKRMKWALRLWWIISLLNEVTRSSLTHDPRIIYFDLLSNKQIVTMSKQSWIEISFSFLIKIQLACFETELLMTS